MQRYLPSSQYAWLLFAAMLHTPVLAAPTTMTPLPSSTEPVPTIAASDTATIHESQFGAAVRSEELDAQRGGTDMVNNNMQVDGSVHDNIASHVMTGSNSIDSGSFANMSGIPTVIQNSGANVLIQNATIINLQLK